jgi:preprotein translocase SecE subunit
MGIGQYLSDTRVELRHVAWPTQTQTIVYTILVALISIGVAAYLGFFDFLFTTGLTRLVASLPANTSTAQQQTTGTTNAPLIQGNGVTITSTPSDANGTPVPGSTPTTQTVPVTQTQ